MELNQRIQELEEKCENNLLIFENEKKVSTSWEVECNRAKLEHSRAKKEIQRLMAKNESKDVLIQEFENLISQLTDQIDKDKMTIQ